MGVTEFANYDTSGYANASGTFTIIKAQPAPEEQGEKTGLVDKASASSDSNQVDTGDNSPLMPVAGVTFLSIIGAVAAMLRKKSSN